MLASNEVKAAAKKKANENLRFRTYLKMNAEEKDLDARFARLHAELFDGYDCSKCRNCCKEFHGSIQAADIEKTAAHLKITPGQLIDFFLEAGDFGEYRTKHMPCDFLRKDGSCMLGDDRPESCKNYPHTNQPGRLESLYGILDAVEVCPVAFEIFERLKQEYGFSSKKRKSKHKKRKPNRYDDSFAKFDFNIDQDENFACIVGYTSAGFPYGTTWEELERLEREDGEGKTSDFKMINEDEDLPF